MSGIPTTREELDRKTYETLEWLIERREQGQISDDQFHTGVDATFNTVSGLVSEDIFRLVSEASTIVARRSTIHKKVFVMSGFTSVVNWKANTTTILHVICKNGEQVREMPKTYASAMETKSAFENSSKDYLKNGWTEL